MISISGSRSHGSALTAWLRTLDAAALRRVCEARPDAARPPVPRSLSEFADRLRRPGSLARALGRVPLPCLEVTETLAALPAPASRTELTALLGTDDEGVAPALGILADHALVWPEQAGTDGTGGTHGTGHLHLADGLRAAFESPLGLGPGLAELLSDKASEELRLIAVALGLPPGTRKQQRLDAVLAHHGDRHRLRALLDDAPPRAREMLRRYDTGESEPPLVTSGSPVFRTRIGAVPKSPEELAEHWLMERALLVGHAYSYQPAQVPAEVTRALRGPGWHAPFHPLPPVPDLVPLDPAGVAREASAAAASFAGQAAALLAECAARPLTRLKSGGIGARELTRLGKAVQCEEAVVRLVLETAHTAGLLAYEDNSLRATGTYDCWAAWELGDQFVTLLEIWWLLDRTPTATRDEDDKSLPALARTTPCTGCTAARQGLLSAAAELPVSQGARKPAELGSLASWHRPLAHQLPQDSVPFATVVREAELLGVLALGALSPLGKALTAGVPGALREQANALLPRATEKAHAGADLTLVVTGTPTARLAALLDSVADREARGTASVWRVGPSSLRRALDAGRTPREIEADLRDISEGPLPQPLTYLIADTARRHGHVRVAPAACVLHGDDAALLAEISVHRRLSRLGLRLVAPTVLLCRTGPEKTLAALRDVGYAPVAETDDGTVRVERSETARATPPLPGPRAEETSAATLAPGTPSPVRTTAIEELAALLLAAPDHAPHPVPGNGEAYGTDTEEILDGHATALPLTDVRQLAYAIDKNEPVTIEYVAASGSRTIRTLSDLEFDPPYLYAYCHLREDDRVFNLSRIQSVLPA